MIHVLLRQDIIAPMLQVLKVFAVKFEVIPWLLDLSIEMMEIPTELLVVTQTVVEMLQDIYALVAMTVQLLLELRIVVTEY